MYSSDSEIRDRINSLAEMRQNSTEGQPNLPGLMSALLKERLRGSHRSIAVVRTSWKHMARRVKFELLRTEPQISSTLRENNVEKCLLKKYDATLSDGSCTAGASSYNLHECGVLRRLQRFAAVRNSQILWVSQLRAAGCSRGP